MPGQLEGKVAIVTGSSRGIGKALAKGFAAEGARVVVTGRTLSSSDPEAHTAERTAREIAEAGGEAVAVRCDTQIEADAEAVVARALDAYGAVDVLVNNAGLWAPDSITGITVEMWQEVLRTNVDGVHFCTRAVLPHMLERGSGTIINMTSGASKGTKGASSVYSVSKLALDSYTQNLASELADKGIAVNALNPGYTKTEGLVARAGDRDMSGVPATEEKRIIPACIWMARQQGNAFTGQVVDESAFGDTWPPK